MSDNRLGLIKGETETRAVMRSLAVLSLQPIQEQFPQRQTLKIAGDGHILPAPLSGALREPRDLATAQVTQPGGPVPPGEGRVGGAGWEGPQRLP